MAYREALTKNDLEDVRSLLNKIAIPRYQEMVQGLTFDLAHNCLELLRDVKRLFIERHPSFSKWRAWGPGYGHETREEGGPIIEHWFGFGFSPRRWKARNLGCYIYFPVSRKEPLCWYIEHRRIKPSAEQEKTIPLVRVLSRRHLDAEKIARTFSDTVKE